MAEEVHHGGVTDVNVDAVANDANCNGERERERDKFIWVGLGFGFLI